MHQTDVVSDGYELTITGLEYGTSYIFRVVGLIVAQGNLIESPPGEARATTSKIIDLFEEINLLKHKVSIFD